MEAATARPGEDEPCPEVQQQLLLPDRLPQAPHSLWHSPFPSFFPVVGPLPACLQPCSCSASRSVLASPPGPCLVLSLAVKAGAISSPRAPIVGVRLPPHAKEASASREASSDLCFEHRGHLTVLHQTQRLKIERQQSTGEEGWLDSLSYPSYSKKSLQRPLYLLLC